MKVTKAILITMTCMLFALTTILGIHSAKAESDTVVIGYVRVDSDSYLNVRDMPSTDSKIIGKLYLNDAVQILATDGEWYLIVYNNTYAYVHTSYVKWEPLVILSDDVPKSALKNDNIPNLPVRYVGYLTESTGAYPLKSNTRNCYIPAGPIAIFSIQDDYAIIAKGRQLLRVGIKYFENIVPLNPYADACEEPIIAAYTTFFSTREHNRVNNIYLGAEAMKSIIPPGKQYSFNGIVGKRSPEKGYLPANAFKGQEVVQDYGGGVCQLSSTLYAAVRLNPYFAITERYDHSMEVDYLPIGMDATVNWNNRDIKFINNYDFNIYVDTYINGGMLTIMIRKVP